MVDEAKTSENLPDAATAVPTTTVRSGRFVVPAGVAEWYRKASEAQAVKIKQLESKYPDFDSQRKQLRWLCKDIIVRLERKGKLIFTNIEDRIREAGYLALILGFGFPPIQKLEYNRDGVSTVDPLAASDQGEPPWRLYADTGYWMQLKRNEPEVLSKSGYRGCDPIGNDMALYWAYVWEESDDPANNRRVCVEPDATQTTSFKEQLTHGLRLWISSIDGLRDSLSTGAEPRCDASAEQQDAGARAGADAVPGEPVGRAAARFDETTRVAESGEPQENANPTPGGSNEQTITKRLAEILPLDRKVNMPDSDNFPYEYGSDLHWLWGWGKRLDAWLEDDKPPNKFVSMLFRPDRRATDAMMRYSVDFPHIVKQIDRARDFAEKWYARLSEGAVAAENLYGAMFSLRDRIWEGAAIIAGAPGSQDRTDQCEGEAAPSAAVSRSNEPASAKALLEDGSDPGLSEADPTCGRKPRIKRAVVEPLIADHLKRRPHDTASEVAAAVRCGVGTVGESRAWKLNQMRLKMAKEQGVDPKAIPLNEKVVDESGASKRAQKRCADEQFNAMADEIDARELELNQRIGEWEKAHPADTPEQIAQGAGCTPGEVERRQAELVRLAAEQAGSAREEIAEEHPATKLPYQKWAEKPA